MDIDMLMTAVYRLNCYYVIPALWADTSLPEVARIPGGLRGPRPDPKTAGSLKGDHLKFKTWIQKFVKRQSLNGEEVHLLDFSTFPRVTSQPTQIMSSSETAKKHLTIEQIHSCRHEPVSEGSLVREETL